MFRLACPKGVHDNRVISFLKNEKEMIETEHFSREPDDEGLVHYIFPGMGEDNFKYIVSQLKNQGVTMIGVDTQLTERKIMKLADLITEDFSKNLNENESDSIIQALKNILDQWENKQYPDDKTRWEEYYMDIQELISDFESEKSSDESDPYSHGQQQSPGIKTQINVNEQKVRKAIRKLIRQ